MATALVGNGLGAVPIGLVKRSDTHPLRFLTAHIRPPQGAGCARRGSWILHGRYSVEERTAFALIASRVRLFLICEPGKVIHTGIERYSDPLALLKSIVSLTVFYLGIVALVYSGKHLHLHLCQPSAFSQFFQSVHIRSPHYNYGRLTY